VPPSRPTSNDTPLLSTSIQVSTGLKCFPRPQGTLYGSAARGAPFDSCRMAPTRVRFDAKVEAGLSKTNHTHSRTEDVKGKAQICPCPTPFAVAVMLVTIKRLHQSPNLYALDSTGVPLRARPAHYSAIPSSTAKMV